MGWKEDWDELNKKKRAQKEAVADVTYRAYQQEREAQGFPSSSVSKGNDIISAVQNGINSLTQPKKEFTWNMKTARQRLLELELPRENWYSGDKPTASEALAQIWRIGQTDKEKASRLYDSFQQFKNDPTTAFYDPYSQATNRKIADITKYGIDVSGGINDEWFKKNAYLMNYYTYGSTNNPLGTAKSRSKEQNAAALYYDLLQDEEKTKKAENEWQALQDEVRYWTGRKDLNLTDQEILNRIDWNNYKTLSSMDESRENGAPIALNRAVGYSRDNLYGIIWEARNGQENGNIANDAVKYRLGAGNGYEENADIRRQNDPNSEYFSPYSNGIPMYNNDMNDTALYFGVNQFDKDWLEKNRGILYGNDQTAIRQYQRVAAAEENTLKAEAELQTLHERIDYMIDHKITNPDTIMSMLGLGDEDTEYSTLAKMDQSLKNGKWVDTTRAIPYSYNDIKREVEQRCAEEENKKKNFPKALDHTFNTGHENGAVTNEVTIDGETTRNAVDDVKNQNIKDSAVMVTDIGTPGEQKVYQTAGDVNYDKTVADINDKVTNGAVPAQTAVDVAVENANQYAGENYVGAITTVKQYEQDAQTLNTLKQQLEELKQKWGIGGSSSKVDMSKVVGTSGSSGGKLNANGATGSKNFGKGNIDLTKRIPVMNEDGTVSTVDSFSVGMDIDGKQKEVLLPTIIDGKRVSEEEAIQHYEETGEYLGIFDTVEEANEYAEQLHKDQEEMFERDFKKFEDENYDAMAEAWSQSADEDEYRQHMFEYYLRQKTGGDYAQYGEDAQTAIELERQIAKLEQKQQEGQEGYEQAKDTVKNVYEQYGIQADISELTDTQAKNTIIRELDVLAPIMATYTPTQYSVTSIFDALLEAGNSKQEAAAYARQTLDQCRKDLETLNHAVEVAGPYVWVGNQEKQNIEREQARLERAIQEAQDFLLRDEGDFSKTAANGMKKAKEALYDKNGKPAYGFMNFGHDGYSELDRAVLDPQWTYDQWTSDGSTKYYLSLQMSDDERATYFYIREKQGEEAAKEYYKRLADDTYGALQVRHSEETAQKNAEFAGSGVVQNLLANAVKVLMAPGKAVAGIYSFYNLMTGQDVNPYSAYYAVNNMSNTIAQTTHEKLNDYFGENTTGAKIAGFLYDALSSAAESSMTAILTGGISLGSEQAASFLGKFGLKAAESFIAAAPMSIGAMGDTIQQALADGATPEQALLKGAASFLSETISEAISIGNITDAFDKGLSDPKGFVDFIKSVAKSSFEEGSEEIVSGIFEDWTDQMIMGEMSKRAQMIKEYQSTVNPLTGKLYTEEEAKQLASRDIFEDILMQGLSGAVSGGAGVIGGYVGGTVTNAANKAVNNAEFRRQFKSGGKFIDNMVKETDARVQTAETNYQQAEDAAVKAREAASDTNLTAEEQQIAAAEADRLDQEAANAKAELETAQQESEKATVDREKWNALREGALQFHNDYQAMQQAEAQAQEAQGTKQETQRRKDAEKAREKYEKSKDEFKKQYSDMAESGIAEQLGIKAEDLEADPVEVADAVFEAENVTETAEESTEETAEEVTAPNAEQAATNAREEQNRRERVNREIDDTRSKLNDAEEKERKANKQAEYYENESNKSVNTEYHTYDDIEQEKQLAARFRQEAEDARKEAEQYKTQIGELEQSLEAPRTNRFGIAVNEAEAQRVVNDMTVLTEATGYSQSDQTAAVAAVLNDNGFGTMASTAAQNLMQEYGSEKVLNGVRKILNSAVNRAGVVLSDVKNAIVTAALNPQGAAHDMLGQMLAGDLTTDGLRNIVIAAQQETADPNVQASMIQQDHENRVDQRTKQLLAQNEQGELKNAETTIEEARNSVAVTQSQYDAAMAEFQETGRRVQELNAQWVYDTNNKDLGSQLINAIKEHEGADNNVRNLQSNLEAAKQKLQKAKEDFAEVEKRVMQAVREQALSEVNAEDIAAAQEMAQQQAAAEAEAENTRQQQNIDRLADEAFIDQIAPDATPEERELIRQRINEQRQQRQNGNVQTDTTVQPENRMNDFIKKLSKRFGVNIEVRDTTNGGTSLRYNGSYDESTNTITIDQGTTQSDVMLDVALHELTHMAERSGLYDRLATALTRIAYQNEDGSFDENRLANDIRARQQMYNARLAMMQQADPTVDATPLTAEDASKEVVADLTRRILYGDEAAINSLVAQDQSVAQRILNGIRNFLKKLAGINDPAVTQLEQTRKLFENALKDASETFEEETERPRTQYSLPSDNILNEQIRRYLNGEYDNLPAPMSQLPTQTATRPSGQRQRQFGSQTAQRSDALHDEVKDYLFSHSGYDPDTNSAQIDRSIDWVRSQATENDPDGYYAALDQVLSPEFNSGSADGQVRMLTVLSMAALKGDVASETRIADAYNQAGTEAGRTLQARRVFAMMTPLGRISILRNQENKLNQHYIDEGKPTRVHLSEETVKLAAEAKTAEDFAKVRVRANKELAAQMPSDWKGKLQQLRYFSMLANPVTHIRNILGNFAFVPAVRIKNAIGAGLESAFLKEGDRTKAIHADKATRQFAKQDAKDQKDVLTGEAKYNITDQVQRERKYFKGLMQWLIEGNSKLLEWEDWQFLRRHYANALAGWMSANNISPEQLQKDKAKLDEARSYAVLEAQKATYRDKSDFASALNRLGQSSKIAGFIAEAAVPFKKTPANILKRGIEYSPIGLLSTITAGSRRLAQYNEWVKNGQKGNMPKKALTPTQYIDKIASGLTGTGVAALGALMSAAGMVRVGFDDDDEIEKQNGEQEYSLKVELFGHDVSYTIDWLAPMSMPFFVGASLFNELSKEHEDKDPMAIATGIMDSMLEISEPIFNLSMLDGVNSLLNTQSYGDTGNNITDIGATLLSNYATSFVPTVLGKIAKTGEAIKHGYATRRETYVPSGTSKTEALVQKTWQKTLAKIPGASYLLKPYVSPLGEEEHTGIVATILQNFVSPGYFKEVEISEMEKELDRLFEATGEKSVVPGQPAKYFQADGEKLTMDAEQYTKYQKSRGTKLKGLLETVVNSPEYKAYGDDARVKMINDAYTYCTQVAKSEITPDANMDKWVAEAQKNGNVMASLVKRREDNAVKEYQDDHKENLIKAIDEDDMDTAYADILALQESKAAQNPERSRKQINGDIRSSLTTHYKPIYQEAVEKGDEDTAFEIQLQLMNLGIGYTASTFTKWRKGQD